MVTGIILKERIDGFGKIEIITQQYVSGLYRATYAVYDDGESRIIEQHTIILKEGKTEADYHRELREQNEGRVWKTIPTILPNTSKK